MTFGQRNQTTYGRGMTDIFNLIKALYPICRSITGNGVRDSLRIIQKQIPLNVEEVPTGTQVFDWTIPKEWNITRAYIKNLQGDTIVDFSQSNLHVVSYSIPIRKKVSLEELRTHCYTIPEHPDWIPYRTSYYTETWGFCISHRTMMQLTDSHYEVLIESSLTNGSLTYGEYYLPGQTTDEVILTCHICHPSLCNDNLSGIALLVSLAKHLQQANNHYSFRFLFIPGTIGSITWLAQNEVRIPSIKHGLVIAGVGDRGPITYKQSRKGNAEIDRAFCHILKHSAPQSKVIEFDPYGYDERQFCSPGFNLPVGRISRTPHGCYAEYHTSADNLDFISLDAIDDSLKICISALEVLENNDCYLNENPKCEPQLGKRGLYRATGGQSKCPQYEIALLWVLNFSDGTNHLLDIAERSGLPFGTIQTAAAALCDAELLRELTIIE